MALFQDMAQAWLWTLPSKMASLSQSSSYTSNSTLQRSKLVNGWMITILFTLQVIKEKVERERPFWAKKQKISKKEGPIFISGRVWCIIDQPILFSKAKIHKITQAFTNPQFAFPSNILRVNFRFHCGYNFPTKSL